MAWGGSFALFCGGVAGGLAAIHGDDETGILMRNAGFLVYFDIAVNIILVLLLWREEAKFELDRQLTASSTGNAK
jgi:hypothetical protein